MSTGATVEELDELVDGLVAAVVKRRALIMEAEQAAILDPDDPHWPSVIAMHREILAGDVKEIALLRAEIQLLPRQRGPID